MGLFVSRVAGPECTRLPGERSISAGPQGVGSSFTKQLVGGNSIQHKSRYSIQATRGYLNRWKLLRGPAAAQCFDEQDARLLTSQLDLNIVAFVLQRSSLRSNDLKVRIDAALISSLKKIES